MSRSLKSLVASSFFFMLFCLPIHFNQVAAERAAWGGNGGWWGGGNREWEGDFDGPGYHRSPCHCYSGYYSYPYDRYGCCHNYYHNHYHPSEYYYDDSVPGAGLYFDFNRCR